MTVIERWWRVTPDPNLNRKTTWTPEMPVLEASWVGASVAGPFVLESHLEGAVSALEKMVAVADLEATGDDTISATWVAAEARKVLARLVEPS